MQVLIVDDNIDFCTTIAEIVGSLGYKTHTSNTPSDAMNFLDRNHKHIGCVFLDIEFGTNEKLTGLDVLEFSRKRFPSIPVIMISGKGSIETAVRATRLGAMNFIEKSIVSKDKIKNVLDSAMEKMNEQDDTKVIHRFLESCGILGKSKKLFEVGDNIIRFGRTDLNILITGETGTGKKLVAKAIHSISKRTRSEMITVDIPNIPKEIFQSELFGHIKGSFTGATETKIGLFQKANKSTLFLDEIGDLPLDLQANLLLPIEERTVRKIGSTEQEHVDIRFVSATDKDLVTAMKEGKFREQLYHRLRECEINIPPLRERKEDIPDIVNYYTQLHNEQYNDGKIISPSALDFIQEQQWFGNIRELYSVLRVTLQTAKSEEIDVKDINKMLKQNGVSPATVGKVIEISYSDRTLKEDIEEVDKKKIENTLDKVLGNVSKAAAQLGVSRETLHNKIRKYSIEIDTFRSKR